MRSILEAVLRDHYGADSVDLSQRIGRVRNSLPRGANEAALHSLRMLANSVLHLDAGKNDGWAQIGPTKLEKEIVRFLLMLRALIEGAALATSVETS